MRTYNPNSLPGFSREDRERCPYCGQFLDEEIYTQTMHTPELICKMNNIISDRMLGPTPRFDDLIYEEIATGLCPICYTQHETKRTIAGQAFLDVETLKTDLIQLFSASRSTGEQYRAGQQLFTATLKKILHYYEYIAIGGGEAFTDAADLYFYITDETDLYFYIKGCIRTAETKPEPRMREFLKAYMVKACDKIAGWFFMVDNKECIVGYKGDGVFLKECEDLAAQIYGEEFI